jgi:hypothetical protein
MDGEFFYCSSSFAILSVPQMTDYDGLSSFLARPTVS